MTGLAESATNAIVSIELADGRRFRTGAAARDPAAAPDFTAIENVRTAELVQDQGWEFLFVLGAPRFVGAVQGVINPVAIR